MHSTWSLFFSKETISAWIGVFGTFFGTFLAGIISALIAMWTYKKQKLIYNNEMLQNKEKGVQIIGEFVDLAIGSLFLINPGPNGKASPLIDMMAEFKKLKSINTELSSIPNELISININVPFQSIRILLKILEIEIEKVLMQQHESENKLVEELEKVGIDGRVLKILEYLTSFSSKPHLCNLYEGLKSEQSKKKFVAKQNKLSSQV